MQDDALSALDWRLLAQIRDFLRAFYDATKACEGQTATIDRVLPIMDFLLEKYEQGAEEFQDNRFMLASIHAGWSKLRDHFNKSDRATAYIAAIVLNPVRKWAFFDDWDRGWKDEARVSLKSFWETKYRSSTGLPQAPNSPEPDLENVFLQWMEEKSTVLEDIDELDRYLTEPRLKKISTVIGWWQDQAQKSRFLLLSLMAIDIFSIPAMSSEPERVFSGAKNTLSDNRASLTMSTIQATQCLKSWFRSGLFTKKDINGVIPDFIS